MEAIAGELRARLRGRRDALQALGQQFGKSRVSLAAWCAEAEPAECFWIFAHASSRRENAVRFRVGTEALALLNALARVHEQQFLLHMQEMWQHGSYATAAARSTTTKLRQMVGYSWTINASADYAGIHERIVGVQRPTNAFLRDFEWLQTALRSTGDVGGDRWRPIPLQISAHLSNDDDLTLLLRNIVKDVVRQQRYCHSAPEREHEPHVQAAVSAGFQIVKVLLYRQSTTVTVNVEGLECLARLAQFGILIGRLPTIYDEDEAFEEMLSVTESLRVLIPARRDNATLPSCIDHVFVRNDTPRPLIPALFSALQLNHTIKYIDLEVERRPFMLDGGESLENARMLWEWVAYALFSRDAEHGIEKLTLDIENFDDFAVDAIEEVLRADDALSILFDADFDAERWVSSSRFGLVDPRDGEHADGDSVYVTQMPLRVRVIDQLIFDTHQWWRVLLPGCGMAWVAASDATELLPDRDQFPSATGVRPFYLHCERFAAEKKDVLMRYLRLVPHLVNTIDMETSDAIQDPIDMNEWTVAVIDLVPQLDGLHYGWNLEIGRLHILVEAAEAGNTRLRQLSLCQTFSVDSTDVVEFLDVLCIADHPLTRRLEELSIAVYASDNSTKHFVAAWHRLLKHNRTLHTICLTLHTDNWVDDKNFVDTDAVAIRTGALDISGKVAFLSVIQDPTTSSSARSRVDTGVLGTIFAFAAPHRIRNIDIEF